MGRSDRIADELTPSVPASAACEIIHTGTPRRPKILLDFSGGGEGMLMKIHSSVFTRRMAGKIRLAADLGAQRRIRGRFSKGYQPAIRQVEIM